MRDLSVEFPIYQGGGRSLKKALLGSSVRRNLARGEQNRITVRALSNISGEIHEGDRVALIGPNGAGKTTLLKALAGIYPPTHGRVYSSGRITSLLDASVGLNPEATGYENIILRGMYMDIKPRDMQSHVAEIAEFTELGDYLEMPVRTYSAGMMVRLAFAISTCTSPDILLMDEWIAAGDAHFLAKAQKRLAAFVSASSIVVLASHSMPVVQQWCNRGILLDLGRIKAQGSLNDVITAYRKLDDDDG